MQSICGDRFDRRLRVAARWYPNPNQVRSRRALPTKDRGLQELLKASCTDPSLPDSRDVAFGVAPRINAAGRLTHPDEALAVFEAALDKEAARKSVDRLNHLNLERRRTVKVHFEEIVESVGVNIPAGMVVYREECPKGIAGLLASRCVERYSVPSIVLSPSTIPGQVVDQEEASLVSTWSRCCDRLVICFFASEDTLKRSA